MINTDTLSFLVSLYLMYGCFNAGKLVVMIKLDRAQKKQAVNSFALSLTIIFVMFFWGPVMLYAFLCGKNVGTTRGD